MSDYRKRTTTVEVWREIMKAHRNDFIVFSSFSAPDGNYLTGNMSEGEMITEYGFEGFDFPIIGAKTNWDIDRSKPCERINETHEYWICVGIEDKN